MATMVGSQQELAKLLNSLIELDFDAIEAYKVAVDKLSDVNDKAELRSFMGDHQRHVEDLKPLVSRTGEKPSDGTNIKVVLTKGKVVLASIMGDRAILSAMKSNEDEANATYERATKRNDLPADVRVVVTKNLSDERRHRAYMEQRLAATSSKKDVSAHPR